METPLLDKIAGRVPGVPDATGPHGSGAGPGGGRADGSGLQISQEDDAELDALVKKYSKEIKTLFGKKKLVPGVDMMGKRMDRDYFRPDWKPKGVLIRSNGPDPMGRWTGAVDSPIGTYYRYRIKT